MAINKVKYGNQTLIDLSTDTVSSAEHILLGKVGHLRDGTVVTGTASGGDQHGTIWQDGQGNVHLDDESGIALQSKTVTPTESQQIVEAGEGYYALDTVTVNAIDSSYVGSGVSRRSSSDLTVSGATVTAPAGYYSAQASKSVATGTAGTPTATKGTVSNHAVTVTPSVTNTTGYITGGTKTGTGVSVSASELVSGTKSITANGTGIDVTNYASVDVTVPSSTPTLITKNITANGTYNASSDSADGYSSVTVNVSGGGGASNFVYGTIIAGTEGSIQTVTIPYNGNGYIVALRLFVDGGNQSTSQSDWYNVIHTYAVSQLSLVKTRMETAPNYTQNNVFINGADVLCQFKNSTSSGTAINGGTGGSGVRVYRNDIDPTNGSTTCLYLNSNNSFKVKICDAENGTYGLLSGVSYTYVAIFSE